VFARICALAIAAAALPAHGVTISIANGAPQLRLTVGSGGGTIDVVSFNIAAASIGNGVAIVGSRTITIVARARATASNSRTATLTADSSSSLSNAATGGQLSFSAISWTASDSDIPSGSFTGTAGQVLATFLNSRQVTTTHTFRYANTQILDAGTYIGRITYTLTMP
jgi:hypothetical protein